MMVHTVNVLASKACSPRSHVLVVERPEGFRFSPGHYARLGLPGLPDVWRAYSLVNAPAAPQLEFLLTHVQGGVLSPALCALQPGDEVLLAPQAFGFFLPSQLAEGERLWLLATGSGVGPFISMLREQHGLQRFARWQLLWSVREAADLAYHEECLTLAASEPALTYLPSVTRDAGWTGERQRIPDLLTDASLASRWQLPPLSPVHDRVMVCGNPDFTAVMRQQLQARGFVTSRRGVPGTMVFEQYWQTPAPSFSTAAGG